MEAICWRDTGCWTENLSHYQGQKVELMMIGARDRLVNYHHMFTIAPLNSRSDLLSCLATRVFSFAINRDVCRVGCKKKGTDFDCRSKKKKKKAKMEKGRWTFDNYVSMIDFRDLRLCVIRWRSILSIRSYGATIRLSSIHRGAAKGFCKNRTQV